MPVFRATTSITKQQFIKIKYKALGMPQKINSASRILQVITEAQSIATNAQPIEAWATLFKLEESLKGKDHFGRVRLIGEQLLVFNREVEYLESSLRLAAFDEATYRPILGGLYNAVSLLQLSTQWGSVQQSLSPVVISGLKFCVGILPNEESEITSTELNEIVAKVEELRALLEDSEVPLRLRTLIRHHIDLIEAALREYPIAGVRVLKEASCTAIGELVAEHYNNPVQKDAAPVSKIMKLWEYVRSTVENAETTIKAVEIGQKSVELLSNILK